MKCLLYAEPLVMFSEGEKARAENRGREKQLYVEKGTWADLGLLAGSALASQ